MWSQPIFLKLMPDEFYFLNPENTDPKRVHREREKARVLKNSDWWKNKKAAGVCHYCHRKVKPDALTLDHLVPIARGGESTKNNLVPACKECNAKKKLATPVEMLLEQLKNERS